MSAPRILLRRARAALAAAAACLLLLGLVAGDAARRRAERGRAQGAIDALAPRLPAAELALSGGARWLRVLSLEEPGAAFADGPALPDPDPAGAAIAPPRAAWRDEIRREAAP